MDRNCVGLLNEPASSVWKTVSSMQLYMTKHICMSDAGARDGPGLGAKIGLFYHSGTGSYGPQCGSNSALIDQNYDIILQLLKINLPPDDIMAVEILWVWDFRRVLN